MQNSMNFDSETNLLLDSLGADPLRGSGFEEELPDPEFSSGDEE